MFIPFHSVLWDIASPLGIEIVDEDIQLALFKF